SIHGTRRGRSAASSARPGSRALERARSPGPRSRCQVAWCKLNLRAEAINFGGAMSRDIATHIADDGVATLTLSRPERRNALSIKLRNEITEQLDGWATDPAIRAVVLTGAGSTFCAGFDLDEFAQAELAPSIKDSSHRYHLAEVKA